MATYLLTMLAQAGDLPVDTSEQTASRYSLGLILIIGMGLLGIAIIFALTVTFHRMRRRLNQLEAELNQRRSETMHMDTWESAAERVDHAEAVAATFDNHMGEAKNVPPPPGFGQNPNDDSDTPIADYNENDPDSGPWDVSDWDPDDESPPSDFDDPDNPNDPSGPNKDKYW